MTTLQDLCTNSFTAPTGTLVTEPVINKKLPYDLGSPYLIAENQAYTGIAALILAVSQSRGRASAIPLEQINAYVCFSLDNALVASRRKTRIENERIVPASGEQQGYLSCFNWILSFIPTSTQKQKSLKPSAEMPVAYLNSGVVPSDQLSHPFLSLVYEKSRSIPGIGQTPQRTYLESLTNEMLSNNYLIEVKTGTTKGLALGAKTYEALEQASKATPNRGNFLENLEKFDLGENVKAVSSGEKRLGTRKTYW